MLLLLLLHARVSCQVQPAHACQRVTAEARCLTEKRMEVWCWKEMDKFFGKVFIFGEWLLIVEVCLSVKGKVYIFFVCNSL